MALKPLKDSFLFAFFNDNAEGLFFERNSGKIILTNKDFDGQGKYARWGKVLAIGGTVTDFNVGDIVLIEAGMWTLGCEFDGVKVWKSDQTKVIAIGEDESVTFAY
jgi:hypothetical protein